MRILLALCIPAIWVWAITLSMIVRSYFDYALYQDYYDDGVTLPNYSCRLYLYTMENNQRVVEIGVALRNS